ncbi:MAG: peptide chain release factor 3 [Lentisphaeria bacterium]|nr:peptide chain release factor 3 [Lentisphaeria bacterium]
MSDKLTEQIKRRRTFAIISHPDAGKTTLTEKLLLYSGMIRTAGMVGGRKANKGAASDWMGMEQERGISITASAMQFEYKDCVINVLDTPGHQDFSEDTYRTLTAADSVIMVIDCSKGVEAQTRKLFDACRLRNIPVITFINKLDLSGKDPLDLMQEVEETLGIQASAINWPLGYGKGFKGVYNRPDNKAHFFTRLAAAGSLKPELDIVDRADLAGHEKATDLDIETVFEELELLEEAGNEFTRDSYLNCEVTPVFFGSAMTNFGVELLFDFFVNFAPCPGDRKAKNLQDEEVTVEAEDDMFSGYVFKIQANMDPRHRDCVAFIRVNSGTFVRDMTIKNNRTGKQVRLARPSNMVVTSRETIDDAFPGDIIGVSNPGHFAIGDSLSPKGTLRFQKLPAFQPELFATVRCVDTSRRKSLDKGIEQLVSEGAIQLLTPVDSYTNEYHLAAVGRLQFEVLQYRLQDEYKVETRLENLPFTASCWLRGDKETFKKPFNAKFMLDQFDKLMVLFSNQWEKDFAVRDNPDHELLDYAWD